MPVLVLGYGHDYDWAKETKFPVLIWAEGILAVLHAVSVRHPPTGLRLAGRHNPNRFRLGAIVRDPRDDLRHASVEDPTRDVLPHLLRRLAQFLAIRALQDARLRPGADPCTPDRVRHGGEHAPAPHEHPETAAVGGHAQTKPSRAQAQERTGQQAFCESNAVSAACGRDQASGRQEEPCLLCVPPKI
eukprot:6212564-Pleurochrysis_carterae.AAC.2